MRTICILLYTLACLYSLSSIPHHKFVKNVKEDQKTIVSTDGNKDFIITRKVFLRLEEGNYQYRKRKIMGKRIRGTYRIQFICVGCEKLGLFVSCYATATVQIPEREESDLLFLEPNNYPLQDEHICCPHGLENQVSRFKTEIRRELRLNPVRPLPELYESIR